MNFQFQNWFTNDIELYRWKDDYHNGIISKPKSEHSVLEQMRFTMKRFAIKIIYFEKVKNHLNN